MDWFLRWPRQALIQVAQHFLAEYDIKCSPETKAQMVQVRRAIQRADGTFGLNLFERSFHECICFPGDGISAGSRVREMC